MPPLSIFLLRFLTNDTGCCVHLGKPGGEATGIFEQQVKNPDRSSLQNGLKKDTKSRYKMILDNWRSLWLPCCRGSKEWSLDSCSDRFDRRVPGRSLEERGPTVGRDGGHPTSLDKYQVGLRRG